MRKATTTEKVEGRGLRWLAVASLAVTFAAFGCTMNRYPGNGEPTSVSPSYGPLNHSITPGSSSGNEGVPPMASSYTGISRVDTDVLATLAAEQSFRGRVLGPVNPDGVQVGVPIQPTGGQFVSPALITNPQVTVNSSINWNDNWNGDNCNRRSGNHWRAHDFDGCRRWGDRRERNDHCGERSLFAGADE